MPRSSELDALCAATANRILCAEAHRAKSDEGVAPPENEKSIPKGMLRSLEAPPGIGPGMKVLQTSALPLGYGAIFCCLVILSKYMRFVKPFFFFCSDFLSKPSGGSGESMKRAYRRELRIRACELATEEAAQTHETEQDGSPKTSVLHTEDSYRSSYPREKPSNRCLETAQSL